MENNGMNYFQNSGYINKRNRKRTLILDVEDSNTGDIHLASGTEFNIQLYEPLIIDKHSEIYLDNFTTFNSMIAQTHGSSAFSLKINEFNINSNIASTHGAGPVQIGEIDNPGGPGQVPVMKNAPGGQHLFNSLIIPNEHRSVSNNHTTVVHKGKKFNYVCDINPQTISSISGKITDLAGNPIFHGTWPDLQFTYVITGITAGQLDSSVLNGARFNTLSNMTTSPDVGVNINGSFLANHDQLATSLHFSTDREIEITSKADIEFAGVDGANVTLHNQAGENPSLLLMKNSGRFIAEFSIISRE
tara:strand:+ start:2108 stop:3016 length:909 start_codon:yes stop_codon:yes gene_type:complete